MAENLPAMPDWRILHATARRYSWQGEGWLSVKTFFGGRAHYSVGVGHHAVDDNFYLVLNNGRDYAINIESRKPVESFCIFFSPAFAAEALHDRSRRENQLLDSPGAPSSPVEFFEKLYPHDAVLSPLLRRLQHS